MLERAHKLVKWAIFIHDWEQANKMPKHAIICVFMYTCRLNQTDNLSFREVDYENENYSQTFYTDKANSQHYPRYNTKPNKSWNSTVHPSGRVLHTYRKIHAIIGLPLRFRGVQYGGRICKNSAIRLGVNA
jgi:hypothetical protein